MQTPLSPRVKLARILTAGFLAAAMAWGQAPKAAGPSQPPAALDGATALRHLNVVIGWYRHASTDVQALGLPGEVIFQEQAQSLSTQVVRLAFQSARSESELISAQEAATPGGPASAGAAAARNRAQAEARTAARVQELQAQAAGLEARLARAPAGRRVDLEAQLERTRSQLDLQQALLEAIRKMETFAETNGEAAQGLPGSINQLARSIPEVLGQAGDSLKGSAPAPARPAFSSSGGLLSQVATLYDCMSTERQIGSLVQRTDRLRELAEGARSPLRAALKATIQESQALADQQAPGKEGTASIQQQTQADRALTDRFKQLSGALLPLSQEVILLEDFQADLGRWQDLVKRASSFVLRAVLIRVSIILLALAVILVLSEAWRRLAFRYVKEPRRRRQFLILRRAIVGFLVAIVLTLGFVTEFSSLATFAGFITAGVAVGLQAVLLSVAAYFFIVGRYGIRVGDRISIAGITGDVVDVGLVRFYLMEMAGTGLDFRPTGRIVVFSNSVLFQAGTPLFKQIPGTEYAWHEVVVGGRAGRRPPGGGAGEGPGGRGRSLFGAPAGIRAPA